MLAGTGDPPRPPGQSGFLFGCWPADTGVDGAADSGRYTCAVATLFCSPGHPAAMPIIIGTYEFAPALGPDGNRVRRDGTTTDWWLIIRFEREVGRYLRHLYQLMSPAQANISEPLWGPHVSIIQGEQPGNPQHWKDREGQPVEIEYAQDPRETDGYVYLPVFCEAALAYRELLGLPREPRWPLHLTIGNRKRG